MSDPNQPDPGGTPKRPLDSPSDSRTPSPTLKKLRDRVSFFEKVWSGAKLGTTPTPPDDETDHSNVGVDVTEIERRLEEERKKHSTGTHIEYFKLRQTPQGIQKRYDGNSSNSSGSFEETVEQTVEEGDLGSGCKMVKFEKITVRKSIREVTTTSSTVRTLGDTSRTPSSERLLEDSAYQSHGNGVSKSSSITSLTGRFPSEECLQRMSPSKEVIRSVEEWDTGSNSSGKNTSGSPSSEWYTEYRNQSFQSKPGRIEYFRSKSEYDTHIAEIRGR